MQRGDTVQWVNGLGFTMTGEVLEPGAKDSRPKVREAKNGTILYPLNAYVIQHGTDGMRNTDRLIEIRSLLEKMDETDGDVTFYKDSLIRVFKELDQSLSNGGYYPQQWTETD